MESPCGFPSKKTHQDYLLLALHFANFLLGRLTICYDRLTQGWRIYNNNITLIIILFKKNSFRVSIEFIIQE